MTSPILRPDAAVTIDGDTLQLTAGSVTLDSRVIPFAQASLELPLLTDAQLATLDPDTGVRVPLEFGEAGTTLRPTDLGLRTRTVDHDAKTVTLELASDEALLTDYATLTDDSAPLGLQASIRAVCEYVLGKFPSITRNLMTTPRGTSTAGFTGSVGGGAAPTLSTASTPGMNVGGVSGLDTFLRAQAVGAGTYIDLRNTAPQDILISPGEVVTASGFVRPSSISGVSGAVYLQFVNSGGTVLATSTGSFALTSGAWTRVNVTGTAPATTARAVVVFRALGTIVAGSRLDLTGMLVEKSSRLSPYKDQILAAGDVDANVTAFWDVTNLHPNPVPASVAGYNIAANGTALTFTTVGSDPVIRWTSSSGTSNLNAGTTSAYRAQPGRTYHAQWDWLSASSGRSAGLVMEFRSAGGTILMQRYIGAVAAYSAVFQTLTVSGVAPAGTETVYVYVTTTGNTVATVHNMRRIILAESDQAVPYFSGASSDANYTYAWTESANTSPSTRTPHVDRPPEALIWDAGQTAWDFLLPLTASVNMVLWCDELRQWWLKLADNRTIATVVSISPDNARTGTDTLSRDDTDAYTSGVVVIYTWTDADGILQRRVDSAGTPDKVLVEELTQAYPGPGVAAAMLARRQGTGRVQEASSIADWTTTPGMSVTFSLPGAPEVIGRVASVKFDLESGFMDVDASGLVDIVPGSIAALVGTIASLPGMIAGL